LWLHSLKVAQLLRSAACLHTNQSRSYLNHLVLWDQFSNRLYRDSGVTRWRRRPSVIITVKCVDRLLWVCRKMHVETRANFTDKFWDIFFHYYLNWRLSSCDMTPSRLVIIYLSYGAVGSNFSGFQQSRLTGLLA